MTLFVYIGCHTNRNGLLIPLCGAFQSATVLRGGDRPRDTAASCGKGVTHHLVP